MQARSRGAAMIIGVLVRFMSSCDQSKFLVYRIFYYQLRRARVKTPYIGDGHPTCHSESF